MVRCSTRAAPGDNDEYICAIALQTANLPLDSSTVPVNFPLAVLPSAAAQPSARRCVLCRVDSARQKPGGFHPEPVPEQTGHTSATFKIFEQAKSLTYFVFDYIWARTHEPGAWKPRICRLAFAVRAPESLILWSESRGRMSRLFRAKGSRNHTRFSNSPITKGSGRMAGAPATSFSEMETIFSSRSILLPAGTRIWRKRP